MGHTISIHISLITLVLWLNLTSTNGTVKFTPTEEETVIDEDEVIICHTQKEYKCPKVSKELTGSHMYVFLHTLLMGSQ